MLTQHLHAELLRSTPRLNRFDVIFMTRREPMAGFKSEYAMRNKDYLKPKDQPRAWTEAAFKKYMSDPYVDGNHLRPQVDVYIPGCIVYHLEVGMENVVDDLNSNFDLSLGTEISRSMDRKQRSGHSSEDTQVPALVERHVKEFYHDDFVKFGCPI